MEIERHTAVLPIAQSKYGFTASVRFQPCTKFSFSFNEFSQINKSGAGCHNLKQVQ